ncbi:MAG: hypothetical protein V4760_13055 [Bdellovibrionota bacterium]
MTNVVFSTEYWRRCSSCKTPINYSSKYYLCSVTTCTRKRLGYVFCSVHCWERHLPGARHRDAAAIEAQSPTMAAYEADLKSDSSVTILKPGETPPASSPAEAPTAPVPPPRPAANVPTTASSATLNDSRAPQRVIAKNQPGHGTDQEILVVASKLKAYIKARSDMSTSDSVMEKLSHKLRRIADAAIDKARSEGRKTVLDRDVD